VALRIAPSAASGDLRASVGTAAALRAGYNRVMARSSEKQPLSPADMQARLASLRTQLYQLEVDFGMGLFEKNPKDFESLATGMQDEIRVLEASLQLSKVPS
jgi:predicted mannosyl-3-phosphoglycerate phosphatase (HAD superfamily)